MYLGFIFVSLGMPIFHTLKILMLTKCLIKVLKDMFASINFILDLLLNSKLCLCIVVLFHMDSLHVYLQVVIAHPCV